MFRPLPEEELRDMLSRVDIIGVIDKNVLFGLSCGTLFYELRSALCNPEKPLMMNFIVGLGGGDVTKEDIKGMVKLLERTKQSKKIKERVIWLDLENTV